MNSNEDMIPKVGDWVQAYMWQSSKPFEHLAWNGEQVQILKRLKKVEDGASVISAIVSHPEWEESLKTEGVEMPMKFLRQPSDLLPISDQKLLAMPQPGDRVFIAATPYQHWYSETLANLPYGISGTFKNYSKANREWIERYLPDRFPWAEVFTFKQLQGEMAIITATGERWKVPTDALRVLEARQAQSSEVTAA